jgi:hypothetical protein
MRPKVLTLTQIRTLLAALALTRMMNLHLFWWRDTETKQTVPITGGLNALEEEGTPSPNITAYCCKVKEYTKQRTIDHTRLPCPSYINDIPTYLKPKKRWDAAPCPPQCHHSTSKTPSAPPAHAGHNLCQTMSPGSPSRT